MTNVKLLIVGGQQMPVENLSEEQIEYLLTSMNVPTNAERVFHESTGALEIKPQTGSKGSFYNYDDEVDPLSELLSNVESDDEDEDEFEDEFEDEDDYELEEEFEESEEERLAREYRESFALPYGNFSDNDLIYFEQNDVDVTNLTELVQAKTELDRIDNEYFERSAKEVASQFVNDEISYEEFKKKLGL